MLPSFQLCSQVVEQDHVHDCVWSLIVFPIHLCSQVAEQAQASEQEDYSKDLYGVLPLIQSTEKPERKLLKVKELSAGDAKVWLRGRLHTSRSKGWWSV